MEVGSCSLAEVDVKPMKSSILKRIGFDDGPLFLGGLSVSSEGGAGWRVIFDGSCCTVLKSLEIAVAGVLRRQSMLLWEGVAWAGLIVPEGD